MAKKNRDDSLPPFVSRGGHVRRWMKYHRRASLAPTEVKRPERYLNASQRIKP